MTRNTANDVGDITGSKGNRLVLLLDPEMNFLDQKRSSVCRPSC